MPRITAYLVLLLPLLAGCKKNKDHEPPFVQVDSPLRHAVFSAGQTVRVKGFVQDEKKLESVTLKLLSVDGNTQLCEPVSLPVSGKELTIDHPLQAGDIHTATGTYQVVVEAHDGTNTKKAYVEIVVNEIPRSFKKLMVVRKSGVGYAVDSLAAGSFFTFLTGTGDLSASAISLYHQLLYMAGRTQGALTAYRLDLKQVGWTLPADMPVTGAPLFFTHVYDESRRVLWQSMAGSTANTLRSLNVNGSVQKNISMQPAHYAGAILPVQDYIIVSEFPQVSGGNPYLSYYYATGFGLSFTTVMPCRAVKMFTLSGHELVIFGNNGNQGEMRIYDKNTNGFWEQVNIPAGRIYDAVQLDADTYIVAHQTGLIRFEHSTTNMITISPGHQVQSLHLDVYSGTLYGAEGSMLRVFDPVTGNELTSVAAADSIRYILPHYNK